MLGEFEREAQRSFEADKPHEACGVFAVYQPGVDNLAQITYFGLLDLQHRGQDAAGIAIIEPDGIMVEKHYGLVQDAIHNNAFTLDSAVENANSAIGHVLYGTSNPDRTTTNPIDRNNDIQPILSETEEPFSLAHNGHVENVYELYEKHGFDTSKIETDSHGIVKLLEFYSQDQGLDKALDEVLPMLDGAYSLVIGDADGVRGIRDPNGFRPLCLGEFSGDYEPGYILASEDSAIRTSGAIYLRDIEPGEIVKISKSGVESRLINKEIRPSLCSFEFAYFARPDSNIEGRNVYQSREKAGQILAIEQPRIADLVVGVPDTGVQAAYGYAKESGIPIDFGFFKNPYTGRTFISPDQISREIAVRLKLRPNAAVVENKRLVVIDDSLVRGTTAGVFVQMLREAGAKEVHLLLSTPPYKHPCHYGMATGNQNELFAAVHSEDEIAELLNADSVSYLSPEGFVESIGLPAGKLCTACTTGVYPLTSASTEVTITPKQPGK